MKQAVKNIAIKSVIYLMIGMMGLLIFNRAFYLHTHKLSDGTVIEHAHPFDKTSDSEPYKSHQHSNVELFFLQNIDLLFLVVFSTLALVAFVKAQKVLIELKVVPKSIGVKLSHGRAPPIS